MPEPLVQTPLRPTEPHIVPRPDEWQRWQAQPSRRKGRAGKAGAVTTAALSFTEPPASPQARRSLLENGQALLVRYPYVPEQLYAIRTAPDSPTHLLLPPGQRLAAPPAINTELFVTGLAELGTGTERQEAVVVRPKQPGQDSHTALLFQSGIVLYCKLIAADRGGMLSVTWDLPPAPAGPVEVPLAQRPPLIDRGRLHTGYTMTPQGPTVPPWVPVATFDDGTRTFVQFAEPLTYTRAPGIFGVTPQGKRALVQFRMYTRPDQPEAGAWLVVHGLWPALELRDSAGLVVRIVREGVQPSQEVSHAR